MKQLLTYFALAYFISWIIWLPLYGHLLGLTIIPTFRFNHAIGGLGPLAASFLTTWVYLKNEGIKQLFKKCIQVKPLIYLIIALFSPFILAIAGSVINHFIHKIPIDLSGLLTAKEFQNFNLVTIFIFNLVFFGFGEEAGWRGFALPRLQNKMNAFTASLVLTVFWALWHVPLFFYRPGYMTMDVAGIAGWGSNLLTGSILLTWLYNSSRASILICAIFHSTIDIAFTSDIADKNIINYMGILITAWGILTIVIFKPKNLAEHERQKN